MYVKRDEPRLGRELQFRRKLHMNINNLMCTRNGCRENNTVAFIANGRK